jgi:hypothetical protein
MFTQGGMKRVSSSYPPVDVRLTRRAGSDTKCPRGSLSASSLAELAQHHQFCRRSDVKCLPPEWGAGSSAWPCQPLARGSHVGAVIAKRCQCQMKDQIAQVVDAITKAVKSNGGRQIIFSGSVVQLTIGQNGLHFQHAQQARAQRIRVNLDVSECPRRKGAARHSFGPVATRDTRPAAGSVEGAGRGLRPIKLSVSESRETFRKMAARHLNQASRTGHGG